jgi:6-phosphogluconate dehydrogenase
MRLGMVGLGKMGGNMVQRLIRGGHEVAVFDLNAEAVQKVADCRAPPPPGRWRSWWARSRRRAWCG